jgi:hypothetical protein
MNNRVIGRRAAAGVAGRLAGVMLILAACGGQPTATTTPRAATATATARSTVTPAATTLPAAPTEATAANEEPFDLETIGWDDRTPFEQALLPAEAPVLRTLAGASVYHLAITLAPDLSALTGQASVRYANQETVPLDEVVFHLHPNLLGGEMTISDVTVDGAAAEPEYGLERTTMSVPLAAPLAPGGQALVAMSFAVQVPTDMDRNYGVLALVDGQLSLAHFYPMVAVYDAAGWHRTPPVPHSDVTFSDVSFYLLEVTAPAGVIVAAGGTRIEARAGPEGAQKMVFAAGPARDIYLAASADYVPLTTEAAGVTLTSYVPETQQANGQAALKSAAAAVEDYDARYGPYPYRELDLVAIPTLALGIEYPGIIALNRDLFDPAADFGNTPVSVLLEATVAHEVGHQWFYGLVGDDQLNEPWLDEALAQYATWRYYLDEQGPGGADGFRQALEGRWARVDKAEIPIGLPAADYSPLEYGAIVYGRGPLFIEALGEAIGQDALTDFLREYATTFRWQIATGGDFKALAERRCGCDLTELFDEWVWKPTAPR